MRSLAVRALFLLSFTPPLANSALAAACPSRTWVAGQEIVIGEWARKVVSIDYDSDGILDLAASLDEPPTKLVTMRGAGNGTFAAPVTLYSSSNTFISGAITALGVADVNGDGYDDLIAADLGDLLIFRGSAAGLQPPTTMFLPYWLTGFTFGNFDADPAVEMVSTSASPSRFYVYDNVGGAFSETRRVSSDGFLGSVASADFDGDGRYDVAVARRVDDENGTVDVHFRNADGSYAARVILTGGSFPTEIGSADFDLDGLPDLAAANWYDATVSVFRNQGSRQFTASTVAANYPDGGGNASTMVLQDVDQDGITDILVGIVNSGSAATTLMGVGDGTFRSPTYFRVFDGQFYRPIDVFRLADFDEDGDLDLPAGTASGRLFITSPGCATQVTLTPKSPLISTTSEATLNVSIGGFGGNMPQPFGTVTLREGTTTVGTGTPNAAGKVSFVVPPMSAGDHTFTAEFSGNSLLSGATSNTATQKVTVSQTTISIETPPTQPVYGTDWPLEISVDGAGGGYEFVTVFVDGVPIDHYTYNPLNLNLTPGPHSIYVEFNGTTHRPASTSAILNVTALKGTPAMFVTGATTVRLGQAHTLEVTLGASAAGTAKPTGTLQLLSGNTQVGAGTLADGFATVNVTLPRGGHDVRIVYSGDSNFNSRQFFITLNVVANQPLAIDVRGFPSAMHISYVVPDGTTSMTLHRRPAGGAWEPATGWNSGTGFDSFTATPGLIYEYQLHTVTNGAAMQSNVDAALLFTDDALTPGESRMKRVHLTELRTAVNLMRSAAGLTPFAFAPTFESSNVIRAQHLLSLQTAAAEARSALGMSAVSFDAFGPGSTIRAVHVRQARDAVR